MGEQPDGPHARATRGQRTPLVGRAQFGDHLGCPPWVRDRGGFRMMRTIGMCPSDARSDGSLPFPF